MGLSQVDVQERDAGVRVGKEQFHFLIVSFCFEVVYLQMLLAASLGMYILQLRVL